MICAVQNSIYIIIITQVMNVAKTIIAFNTKPHESREYDAYETRVSNFKRINLKSSLGKLIS